MNLIESLKWRYATKRMVDKKIPQNQIDEILEAIHLAPTSLGLEPYKVIITDNKEIIQKIYEEACPQLVVKQCSHLLIFKTMNNLSQAYIEAHLQRMKSTRNATEESIESYRSKINSLIERTGENLSIWTSHQTYIAMAYATVAAANLNIDSTPIEGFNPRALDKLLNLDTEKESATLLLTLGYRDAENDRLANYPKVRKPMENLVETL